MLVRRKKPLETLIFFIFFLSFRKSMSVSKDGDD
jgi:hypothetical protein